MEPRTPQDRRKVRTVHYGERNVRNTLLPTLCLALLASCATDEVELAARRLEPAIVAYRDGKEDPRGLIDERMRELGLPGLSIAVIDDYEIDWARGFGVVRADHSAPITTDTLFQAASISKSVAAVGIMTLVEKGRLGLDDEVNGILKSWKIPVSDGIDGSSVTVRHLLGHTASLTVHGFRGYEPGERRPTVVQILDGRAPANNPAVRVETSPGSRWQYSGGGYTVAQLAVSDLTGEGFADFMRSTVLNPLRMNRSSYEQPLPDEKRFDAAVGHDAEGHVIRGLWRIHPELAAAGLWTTPTELARFAIEMQLSLEGRSSRVLSQGTTRLMLTVDELGRDVGEGSLRVDYALGFALLDHGQVFAHSGSNAGFKVIFMATRRGGKGVVVMSNAHGSAALLREVTTAVRNVYGWPRRR